MLCNRFCDRCGGLILLERIKTLTDAYCINCGHRVVGIEGFRTFSPAQNRAVWEPGSRRGPKEKKKKRRKIKALAAAGMTVPELARKFNCARGNIYHFLK